MKKKAWTIEDSKNIYGIGERFREFQFLDIDNNGRLCLKIKDQRIAIIDILNSINKQMNQPDLTQPPSVTLRIPQLVEYQIKKLVSTFKRERNALNYNGEFFAVYPIKVNQQEHAVKSVLESDEIKYGLEAGTKAEFLITLDMLKDKKKHLIMCNGVKDEEYLELAIRKHFQGFNIIISVETLRELKTIQNLTPDLSKLKLCLRIKPYIPVSGHWAHSASRNSKFGLSISEFKEVLDYLVSVGKEDCIHALHAHIGSQISKLKDFKYFAQYLVGFYNELRYRGFKNLNTLDFGGGLPIDYKGLITEEQPDIFQKYAQNLIKGVLSKVEEEKHPNILIESGRAITALSSMIVIQILEIIDIFPQNEFSVENLEKFKNYSMEIDKISNLNDFKEKWEQFLSRDNKYRILIDGINNLYQHELITGKTRQKFRNRLAEEFNDLLIPENLHDPYIKDLFNRANKFAVCNFSIFNSACDHVLVGQYFPIFPIEFLDQQPDTIVRIVDITCDSDGEISIFTTKKSDELVFTKDYFPISIPNDKHFTLKGVPVPCVDELNESYLVIGLTGAYQDIIEFDHNLLGDLPDVEVILNDNNEWKIRWIAASETVTELLNKVGHQLPVDYYKVSKSSYAKDSWNRLKKVELK